MGELIQLSRYRAQHPTDDAVDESVTDELRHDASNASWFRGFMAQMEQDDAAEDMLYVCLNRPLVERMMQTVDDLECVLTAERMSAATAQTPVGTAHGSLSSLVEELRLSTHVLWLNLPDHYAKLAREFRRRVDRYNRLCATFTESH